MMSKVDDFPTVTADTASRVLCGDYFLLFYFYFKMYRNACAAVTMPPPFFPHLRYV
ncbi:Uncharacterized protein APZ42_016577 [Daphnia magna]|uniref:Uncharacterized protein n=1 Tax=Daphnia magna TaxID=35525 RepID=A0A0P5X1Y3_9CRUS|nr:Uncharacterized protein APZ42_016577 [Daphnia magna]